jgi:hypothetical protein
VERSESAIEQLNAGVGRGERGLYKAQQAEQAPDGAPAPAGEPAAGSDPDVKDVDFEVVDEEEQ